MRGAWPSAIDAPDAAERDHVHALRRTSRRITVMREDATTQLIEADRTNVLLRDLQQARAYREARQRAANRHSTSAHYAEPLSLPLPILNPLLAAGSIRTAARVVVDGRVPVGPPVLVDPGRKPSPILNRTLPAPAADSVLNGAPVSGTDGTDLFLDAPTLDRSIRPRDQHVLSDHSAPSRAGSSASSAPWEQSGSLASVTDALLHGSADFSREGPPKHRLSKTQGRKHRTTRTQPSVKRRPATAKPAAAPSGSSTGNTTTSISPLTRALQELSGTTRSTSSIDVDILAPLPQFDQNSAVLRRQVPLHKSSLATLLADNSPSAGRGGNALRQKRQHQTTADCERPRRRRRLGVAGVSANIIESQSQSQGSLST